MRSASRPCASDSTAVLSSRSMRSPNSTTSAVSPAGRTLYASMTSAPERTPREYRELVGTNRIGLVGAGVALARLGGQEPRLDARAAPQRIHVENRQLRRKQAAQIAAVERDEDRSGKGPLDDALLD